MAKTSVGQAALAASPKLYAFGAALTAAMGPIGWIIGAIALLVGGLIALDAAMKSSASQKWGDTLNELNTAVSLATDNYNKLTEASNSFIESFKQYDNLQNRLKVLIEGTDEYRATLTEVIKLHNQLIEGNGEEVSYVLHHLSDFGLEKKDIKDKNGLYTKEFLDAVQQVIVSNTTAASGAVVAAENEKARRRASSGNAYADALLKFQETNGDVTPEIAKAMLEAYQKSSQDDNGLDWFKFARELKVNRKAFETQGIGARNAWTTLFDQLEMAGDSMLDANGNIKENDFLGFLQRLDPASWVSTEKERQQLSEFLAYMKTVSEASETASSSQSLINETGLKDLYSADFLYQQGMITKEQYKKATAENASELQLAHYANQVDSKINAFTNEFIDIYTGKIKSVTDEIDLKTWLQNQFTDQTNFDNIKVKNGVVYFGKEDNQQQASWYQYLFDTKKFDTVNQDWGYGLRDYKFNAVAEKVFTEGSINNLVKSKLNELFNLSAEELERAYLNTDKIKEISEDSKIQAYLKSDFGGTLGQFQQLSEYGQEQLSKKKSEKGKVSVNLFSILQNAEEINAIVEMINDGTIEASDNIEILAKKLNTSIDGVSSTARAALEQAQGVSSAVVQQFLNADEETLETRQRLLNKFMAGEGIEAEQWANITDDKGNSIYTLDPMQAKETIDYLNNLNIEVLKARASTGKLNEIDLVNVYQGQTSSLKEVNDLHKKLQNFLKDENAKQLEASVYQQQYNKILKTTLEELGVTVEEWNYLKNSIKGITDEDLIIRFKVDSNFDNQKKMFEAWQNTGFNVSDSNRFNLAASLAEDLDLSAQEVDSFLNSPEGQGILQKFYLGTPEERQAAWEELQAWYRERKILLDIELDYSKKDDELSKILTDAKETWETAKANGETTLTFTAWIQLDDNKFKKQIETALTEGKITEEQAQEFWGALGIQAIVSKKRGKMFTTQNLNGNTIMGYVETEYIDKITYEPIGSTEAPDGGGGGGGSPSTPAMYESKREDSSLRYKDTQNQISDLEKDADKLRKKLDLTWGPDSQNDLDLYKKKLDAIADTYRNLLTEANNYRESDKINLQDTFNQLSNIIDLSGVQFNFDPETGLILNEQQVFNYIRERFNTVFVGQASENTKDADKLLEALKQYFNDYQTAIKNSVEWAEKLEDTLNKQKAWNQFYKLQDEYNTELRMSNAELKDHDNYLKEINRKLTNQNKIISNSAGLRRLAEEDKYIDILHEESSALEKQIELKKAEQDLNKKYLENLLKANRITNETLGINEDQLIDQVAITTALRDSWETLIGILGTSEEVEKFANEVLNIVQKITEGTQSVEEITDKIEDLRLEEQAKNYEKLVEKLNNKLQKTKNELSLVSYEFSKLSSNFYTMGEAAALFGEQGNAYLENLQSYADHYAQLNDSFKKGAISQKDFAEGLQQTFDGILENLIMVRLYKPRMMN